MSFQWGRFCLAVLCFGAVLAVVLFWALLISEVS